MDRLAERRWIGVAIGFAVLYPVVGVTFAAAANPFRSNATVVAWRLAAWLACAAAFAIHLGYERLALRSSASRAALRAAIAVALGAFALAVWILVRAQLEGASSRPSPKAPWALLVFPLVTGVPAFVAGFAAVALLARVRRRGG